MWYLSTALMLPGTSKAKTMSSASLKSSAFMQEYNVLQHQPLTVLRDLLSCPADSYLGALGMAVPGAYLYIEGTFYNDMRQPGCVDYSEQILQFCDELSLMPPKAPVHPSCEASWRSSGFSQSGAQSWHSDSIINLFSCMPTTELGQSIVVLAINLQKSEGRPWG